MPPSPIALHIDILTLYPAFFAGPLQQGGLKRAQERGVLTVGVHNIRDYATSKHHTVDDYPYGGGAGMVMQAPPLAAAVEHLQAPADSPIILLTPRGRLFQQTIAADLASRGRFILICGQFEGIDERVHDQLATDELSIGDYVLSGGEPAALVIVDAVSRLLPGAITAESTHEESHNPTTGLLEYPHYTRPPVWRDEPVPDILLSGNHAAIARWRREQALRHTFYYRPDLLARAAANGFLSMDEQRHIAQWEHDASTPPPA